MTVDFEEIEQAIDKAESLLRTDPKTAYGLVINYTTVGNLPPDIDVLVELVLSRSCIFLGNPIEGEVHGRNALNQARLHGLRLQEGKAQNNIGICRFILRDLDSALGHYHIAELIFSELGSVADLMRVCLNVANVKNRSGDISGAIQDYERALSYSQQEGDIDLEAKILSNMSTLYYAVLNDAGIATTMIRRAISIHEELNDLVGMAKGYGNLSDNLRILGEAQEAYDYAIRGLNVAKSIGAAESYMPLYFGIINTALDLGRPAEAERYLEEAEAMDHSLLAPYKALLLVLRVIMMEKQQRFQEALSILEQEMPTLGTIEDLYYRQSVYTCLSMCQEALGMHKEALENYKISCTISENVSRERNEARLINIRVRNDLQAARVQAELDRVRNDELQKAVETLTQLQQQNAEYLAFMAHELKSPLHTIRSISQLLRDEASLKEHERSEFYDHLHELSGRMFELINRELQRAQGKTNIVQAIDARPVFTHVLNSAQFRAREKDILLVNSIDASVMPVLLDERALVSVLENLISNAIKFSLPNTRIRTEIRVLPQHEPTKLFLSVEDQGPGLIAADREKIFQPFSTLSAKPTQGEDSSGIGLHYVKRLVDSVNGKIWCESKTGEGATFCVELPLAYPKGAADGTASTAAA
jgi:signal transduction histidine kinase